MSRSVSFAPQVTFEQTLDEAFPKVDPNYEPWGSRVLVQIRTSKNQTKGGIVLPDEVKDTIIWNTQVGKIRACGPVAFRDRKTLEPWPEGAWCEPGVFARTPKYGGDKFEVPLPNGESALFIIFNDLDLLGRIPDPLSVIAFV